MRNRVKLSKLKARRDFKRGLRTEKRNIAPPPQRGGYRM